MSAQAEKQVVILGGGFAGVYTALYLQKLMTASERKAIHVTLVSNENYIVFQPLLPEVISGTIETFHCITPIRRIARNTRLVSRTIEQIDLEKRTVRLSPEYVPRSLLLPFDHLIIALGSRLDYDCVPGMREHAIAFKYLGDALRLRDAAIGVLEEANIEADPEEKRRLLTFVVGGGGFSGVECIAELNDFLTVAVREFSNITRDEIRCILVQSGTRILPELDESLAKYAHRILDRRGIEIQLDTRLTAISSDGALLQNKTTKVTEKIETRTVVSTIPSTAHEMVAQLPCEQDRGRVKVSPCLDLPGFPNVWALGDCASVPQKDGIASPPTAQHALRQAKTCARNVLASIRGKPLKAFDFTGLGSLASLGRRSAVANIMGIKLKGLPAWIVWRCVYLSKFPGLDRKIRIAMDWLLDLVLPRDITQIRIFKSEEIHQEHFHAGELVFRQGDFGNKFYVVVKGEVEVVKDGSVLSCLGENEMFGEIALVSDLPRTATVRAKTAVDLVSVARPAFETLLARFPGVHANVIEALKRHGVDTSELVINQDPQASCHDHDHDHDHDGS